MRRFDDQRYYLTSDEDLLMLGSPASLAKQRSRGEGPAFVKLGRRILYRGCDLNQYLDDCLVRPTSGPGSVHRDASSTDPRPVGPVAGSSLERAAGSGAGAA